MSNTKIEYGEFLLSTQLNPLSFLEYQLVYQIKKNEKYIRSVNVVYRNKILKKIYLNPLLLISETINIEKLILELILDEKSSNKESNSKPAKRKKTNKTAQNKAAKDLITTLGL